MKYRLIASSLFLSVFLLLSCKDKTAFTISGEFKTPVKLKTVYLLETDSGQVKVVDSAALTSKGTFEFKHQSPYLNLYKLRADTSMFDLIVQNGDAVKFSADLADPAHTYQVTGSEESARIKEFNQMSKVYNDNNSKLAAEFDKKSQLAGKQSDSLVNVFMPVFQKNMSEYSNAVLKFASANQKSLAGFYAVSSLDIIKYEPQLVAYADEIKNEFAGNPTVQQFIKTMEKAKPLSIGHQAPDFTITGMDGKPVKLSDYRGKYVMIDFWASWCIPCRQENPNVLKQYNTFHPKGFNILSISLDKDKSAWLKAVKDDKLSWTQASDLNSFQGAAEMLYQIQAIPSNFMIDPKGIIVEKNVRGIDLQNFLAQTIK